MASQTICIATLAIYALTITSCMGMLCNPKCPRIYQPVCAVNNYGQTKTFNNLCLMEYEACINRDAEWRLMNEGECGFVALQSCPTICPLIYAPICGMNNYGVQRTFENKCQMEVAQCTDRDAGWKILSERECTMVPTIQPECPSFCTLNYNPVCGQDQTGNMKTFANLCTFKMEQCNNRAAAWKVVAETQCKQPLLVVETSECTSACTDDYTPVCGMSNTGVFKTFPNKCMFDMEDCNNRDAGWKLLSQGMCSLKKELEETTACNKACTQEYDPVCAEDNTGNMQTFGNMCMFEIEQCNNRDAGWKVIAKTECIQTLAAKKPNCPSACTDDYSPVCGISNTGVFKTFANKCTFDMEDCNNRDAGWKLLNQGACSLKKELEDSTVCKEACTLDYRPVCAQDNTGNLKTFGNKCSFEVEQCNNRDAGWKILSQGTCDLKKILNNGCDKPCTREYRPVCAQDNTGNMKTFGNKCMFEVAQCNNRDAGWKIVSQGTCDLKKILNNGCDKPCTREYEPVCAQDNTGNMKTFGNKCMFEVAQCNNRDAGWKIVSQGTCDLKKILNNGCDKPCTREYRPVCAQDNTGNMKTFGNKCMFEVAQCNNRDAGWKIVSQGTCDLKKILNNGCDKPCTREYEPVCAQDNTGNMKTFGNKCMFEVAQCNNRDAGWKLVRVGECSVVTRHVRSLHNCPLVCPRIYAPVEAVNTFGEHKIFVNECQFRVAQCFNPSDKWLLVHS